MDKVFEKFGVYDIIGVLLPGICMVIFSDIVLRFVYNISFNFSSQINETVAFLVISYFFGLVFQELGSSIQKIFIHKNNRLLKKALKPEDDSNTRLSKTERDGVFNYVKGKLNLDTEDYVVIYNYCKYYHLKENNVARMDKDQSISAMSRSLCLYFAILAVIAVYSIFRCTGIFIKLIELLSISLFFAVLLFFRTNRFAKIRYINIIRNFYYNVVVKA